MTFGEMIRTAREKRGLSQVALSDALGVDRVTVGRWERNEVVPSYERVAAIAREIGADVGTLLRLAGYKPITV